MLRPCHPHGMRIPARKSPHDIPPISSAMTPLPIKQARRTISILTLALLASCGGSGDDGGASSTTPYLGTLLNGPSCSLKYYAQSQPAPRIGTDPYYSRQWYLKNTGILSGYSGLVSGEDLQIENAWTAGYKGQGVRVALLDDGLEVTHADLAPNIVEGASYNYVSDDTWKRGSPWPLPCTKDFDHGTAVGGVIAARDNNGIGGHGVAPRASLVGYNALLSDEDRDVLDAMVRDKNKNDIYNNSWGASDNGHFNAPTSGTAHINTILEGIRNGRNGRGVIYTFAAGNGGHLGDYSALDGNVSVLGAIPVCATNASGLRAPYSEPGPNLIVCAPSSDLGAGRSALPDVMTTGLQNGYREDFNGTSAATPMVSGVIALMLQANPNLTWRDVPLILAKSARQVDPGNAGWTRYGGYHYNHEYGFGVANATAAVQLARGWESVGGSSTLKQCGPYAVNVGQPIPETTPVSDTELLNPFTHASALNQPAVGGLSSKVRLSGCNIQHIEHIDVTVTATDSTGNQPHPSAGDLQITLTSPSGQSSTLTTPHPCYSDEGTAQQQIPCMGLVNFSFGVNRHLDEPATTSTSSDWTLSAADRRTGNTGRLKNWSITFYGR